MQSSRPGSLVNRAGLGSKAPVFATSPPTANCKLGAKISSFRWASSFFICKLGQRFSKYGSHHLKCPGIALQCGIQIRLLDENLGQNLGKILRFECTPRGSFTYSCLKPSDFKCLRAVSTRVPFCAWKPLEPIPSPEKIRGTELQKLEKLLGSLPLHLWGWKRQKEDQKVDSTGRQDFT